MLVEELHDPRRWYGTNLVGVSAEALASASFNAEPRRLYIAATRQTHPGLFGLLRGAQSQPEAAEIFGHYMGVAFGVGGPRPRANDPEARAYRSTYVKLLQGWGFDSNAPAGALLKGWVESRFGIAPTFHKAPLEQFPSEAWMRYLEEKLSSRFHNNCILLQLDVLFEYTQLCLERFQPFGPGAHVQLYRGVQRAELQLLRGSLAERCGVIRLNNLVSFSLVRERAEELGDIVLTAQVPLAKLLVYPGVLQDRVLDGEGEALVLGGDFEVGLSYL
jgi:NAD+--dinitrogen-reductase ADP-D-ribosyltransferase